MVLQYPTLKWVFLPTFPVFWLIKMKIDELDIEILNIFMDIDDSGYSNCDIAKTLYEIKGREELIRKTSLVDYRLKKLVKAGFIVFKKGRSKRYFLNTENSVSGKTFITVNDTKIDVGESMVITLNEGQYLILFYKSV